MDTIPSFRIEKSDPYNTDVQNLKKKERKNFQKETLEKNVGSTSISSGCFLLEAPQRITLRFGGWSQDAGPRLITAQNFMWRISM